MAGVEPIIVVLGPRCGGTSAVAGVLHHLGVFMGREFFWTYREANETWEERRLSLLCGHAFRSPGDRLAMDPDFFRAKLRDWAGEHRRAARAVGRRPGAKDPLLCVAADFICTAWDPVVPVVVDRPVEKVVASLNRLGWLRDERERRESTAHLIAVRDRALAGAATVRVDFEELRAAPAVVIARLVEELGLQVTEAQLQAATDSITSPADARRAVGNADRYGIDALRAKVERNPDDGWAVSTLASAYFDSGDFANARRYYARQVQLGGPDVDVYLAMWRVAESMERIGLPWPDVEDAYLRAWEFRPIRAEPFYAIAGHYRAEKRYQLGYLFAERAAAIALPADDIVAGPLDSYRIYTWAATDEQAVCASGLGRHAEVFALCRRLLARPEVPDDERRRIARNRDVAAPAMIEAAASYPDAIAASLAAGRRDGDVTVSLLAGSDRGGVELTLNSFLHCCTDIARAGHFLVCHAGLSGEDRAVLGERYPFLDFTDPDPDLVGAPGVGLAHIGEQITGRYWLHLGAGWRFFAPEAYLTRLIAVLEAEPAVFQVGVNLTDAAGLTGACAEEAAVRRAPGAGRYLLTEAPARGPAMFDTTRLKPDPMAEPGVRAAAGPHTASLDEVLCIKAT